MNLERILANTVMENIHFTSLQIRTKKRHPFLVGIIIGTILGIAATITLSCLMVK